MPDRKELSAKLRAALRPYRGGRFEVSENGGANGMLFFHDAEKRVWFTGGINSDDAAKDIVAALNTALTLLAIPRHLASVDADELSMQLRRTLRPYRGGRFQVGENGGSNGMLFFYDDRGNQRFMGGINSDEAATNLVTALNTTLALLEIPRPDAPAGDNHERSARAPRDRSANPHLVPGVRRGARR